MMSKTHIAAGVAAALAACRPGFVGGVIGAVIGGAAGGILCDIECHSAPSRRDSLVGRVLVCSLSALLLALDWHIQGGLLAAIFSQSIQSLFWGVSILAVTCVFGHFTAHRTFTHSLFFVSLISLGFCLITPLIGLPAFFGGLSHLTLDTLNKKPVPWLYPLLKRGLCFRLCSADKTANTALLWTGCLLSGALLFERIAAIS